MGLSYHHESFRLYLQSEFERRCRINANYSLRSFAKSLNVESSVLSKILRKKRALTPKTLDHICERLGMNPATKMRMLADEAEKQGYLGIKAPKMDFRALEMDKFQAISSWYHFAILELVRFKDFSIDPKWIAQKLNIGAVEAFIAVERLERLGMLVYDAESAQYSTGNFSTLGYSNSTAALRSLQKDILDQAKTAIDEVPMEQRENATLTLATSSKKIEEAKRLLQKFRRDLCALLQDGDEADVIYQISTHFFPVSTMNSLSNVPSSIDRSSIS